MRKIPEYAFWMLLYLLTYWEDNPCEEDVCFYIRRFLGQISCERRFFSLLETKKDFVVMLHYIYPRKTSYCYVLKDKFLSL